MNLLTDIDQLISEIEFEPGVPMTHLDGRTIEMIHSLAVSIRNRIQGLENDSEDKLDPANWHRELRYIKDMMYDQGAPEELVKSELTNMGGEFMLSDIQAHFLIEQVKIAHEAESQKPEQTSEDLS